MPQKYGLAAKQITKAALCNNFVLYMIYNTNIVLSHTHFLYNVALTNQIEYGKQKRR